MNFNNIFFIFGIVSFVGILGVGSFLFFMFSRNDTFVDTEVNQSPKIDTLDKKDAEFILNSAGLNDYKIKEIVHSYRKNPSFTGDHTFAYAIKIDPLKEDLILTRTSSDYSNYTRWYRGNEIPAVVSDAVTFSLEWVFANSGEGVYDLSWFPKEDEIKAGKVYVYPEHVYYSGVKPSSASVIFIRPSDNMVFYTSTKI